MPSINCKCGVKLSYGEIPNPVEWLIVSDEDYNNYTETIDSEALYREMKSILKCFNCGRLWIFWNGFGSEPSCYAPE